MPSLTQHFKIFRKGTASTAKAGAEAHVILSCFTTCTTKYWSKSLFYPTSQRAFYLHVQEFCRTHAQHPMGLGYRGDWGGDEVMATASAPRSPAEPFQQWAFFSFSPLQQGTGAFRRCQESSLEEHVICLLGISSTQNASWPTSF